MRKMFTLLMAVSFAMISLAQDQNPPSWESTFDRNVNWQRVTSFGTLIVSTASSLVGVDTQSGKVIWERTELANLDEARYQPVENSPFVQVTAAGLDGATYLFEPFNGTIVFDSKKAGIAEVIETHVLPSNISILIQGKNRDSIKPSLYMIDLKTGDKLWQKDDEFGMLTAFKELKKDHFLLSTLWKIYKINSRSGEIIWEQHLDPEQAKQLEALGGLGSLFQEFAESSIGAGDVIAEFYPMKDNRFLMGFQAKSTSESKSSDGKVTTTVTYSSGYSCLNLSDGSLVWEEPVTFKGMLGTIVFDDSGLIVCPDQGDNTMVNKLDYETGNKQWGKKGNGTRVKGGVVEAIGTDAGYLLLLESGGSGNYKMTMLDPATGLLKFDKYAKLKGQVTRTELLDAGLFYATDEEANILNVNDGSLVWDKSIRTGRNLNVSNDESIFIFSPKDEVLYEVNKSNGSFEQLSKAEIKFQDKEEPHELELRDRGVCIMGMQNIAMVNFDGNLEYNMYYEAPKLPGILRALNAAMAIRADYIGAVSTMAAGAFAAAADDPDNPFGQEISMGISGAYQELGQAGFSYAGQYMDAVRQRFQATATSNDFIFVMTVGEGRKDNRLVRVNKENGMVMDYVSLGKDKDPVYEIDNIDNMIYYRIDTSVINGYKF